MTTEAPSVPLKPSVHAFLDALDIVRQARARVKAAQEIWDAPALSSIVGRMILDRVEMHIQGSLTERYWEAMYGESA